MTSGWTVSPSKKDRSFFMAYYNANGRIVHSIIFVGAELYEIN